MNYLPVRLSTLRQSITLGFDLYLQLPHKIIKYIDNNDFIEKDQINSLKSKKVRKLLIFENDELKYQQYMDNCLSDLVSDNTMDTDTKADIVTNVCETNVETMMKDPHSHKTYGIAKSTSTKLIQILSTDDEMLKSIFDKTSMEDKETNDSKIQKHAVNTTALTVSFADYLGFDSTIIEQLGIAALFHDIAYAKSSSEIKQLYFKEVKDMSNDEFKLYQMHPREAAEILQDKAFASSEVIDLIVTHEERQGKNGFPNKIKNLNSQQECLALCALYDRKITCLEQNREDVLKNLMIDELGNFELETLKSFKKFVTKSGL